MNTDVCLVVGLIIVMYAVALIKYAISPPPPRNEEVPES